MKSALMKSFSTFLALCFVFQLCGLPAMTLVRSLTELNTALEKSDEKIKLEPGDYDLNDLPQRSRVIAFSGSNNEIDLRGARVNVTVGLVDSSYLVVTGNANTIVGGEFEDTYESGIKVIKDFSAYNKDRKRLARGLRGDAVMEIKGNENTVKGIKLTVRGSFPYGYGSFYGIGHDHVFGLNKRCGILINGMSNTLDGVEV